MIDQYFEGTLPREKWEEFSTHLSNSYKLRKEFRKRAALHDYLHSSPKTLDFSSHIQKKRFSIIPIPFVLLAACLVIGLIIINTNQLLENKNEVLVSQTNSNTENTNPIAKLIDYYDTKITNKSTDTNAIKFNRGHYEVTQGSVHLRFLDCVILFSGPGSFEIVDPKFVKVTEGKIRVIVLNKKGHEFTIQTPTNQFIDWGTEFCLNVQKKGEDLINVHEGVVEVRSLQDKNLKEKLNRHSEVLKDTKITTFAISKGLKNNIPGVMGDLRNTQLRDILTKDKDVIGIYDFKQPQKSISYLKQRLPFNWTEKTKQLTSYQIVENLHNSSQECSHALLHGTNRTNGRWENLVLSTFI